MSCRKCEDVGDQVRELAAQALRIDWDRIDELIADDYSPGMTIDPEHVLSDLRTQIDRVVNEVG